MLSFFRMWVHMSNQWTTSSPAEWILDKLPSNLVEGHKSTTWDIVWSHHKSTDPSLQDAISFYRRHSGLCRNDSAETTDVEEDQNQRSCSPENYPVERYDPAATSNAHQQLQCPAIATTDDVSCAVSHSFAHDKISTKFWDHWLDQRLLTEHEHTQNNTVSK